MVGVCVDRSSAMVVAMLGVLKAGGGYVRLDPAYPPVRLEWMLTDTAAPVVVTRTAVRDRIPAGSCAIIDLDADEAALHSTTICATVSIA